MSEFSHTVIDDTLERPNGGRRMWVLIGPLGGVHLSFCHFRDAESILGGWSGGDIVYHSPHPQHPGQRQRRFICPYVPGSRCYESGMPIPDDLAEEWWTAGRDDEIIWRMLELAYQQFFTDMTPDDSWTRMSRVLSVLIGRSEAGE